MLQLNVKNETSRLRAVVLGTAEKNEDTPTAAQAYDPKSLEHIVKGTYPNNADMEREMEAFNQVFQKYDVTVYRPQVIDKVNQIFTRDIGFVIDDIFMQANILPDRDQEFPAIKHVISQIDPAKFVHIEDQGIHIEGGDVILHNGHIFIGTYKDHDYPQIKTARTNMAGVNFIRDYFPNKTVREFDLVKSTTEARDNALHLDCCFQPIGKDKAIIYKDGFRNESDYKYLLDFFGEKNLYHIDRQGMYNMNSNVFSISPEVVVSGNNPNEFGKLNEWLRNNGFTVEEIPYSEISKQEGLLRCSTLPLIRD
jgi:N-dimethylarginine dimethylaminohydrolase